MPRLYDFLPALGASVIEATHSRYVIDLNRAPDSRPLYAGASNTELCPLQTFDNEEIYREGQRPGAAEVAERREAYWQRSEEHTSELQSLMRISYAVFCLKKKKQNTNSKRSV